MSILPSPTFRRARNVLFGDLGAIVCANGPVWTAKANIVSGVNASNLMSVGNGVGLAYGGAAGNANISRTVDGAAYATINVGAGVQDWSRAAYGVATWVLLAGLAAANAVYATSVNDGVNWTTRAMPVAAQWTVCEFANGIFLAIAGGGAGSNTAYTSPDGINWTLHNMDRVGTWTGAAYNTDIGRWIAVGADGKVSTSDDNGLTWLPRAAFPDIGPIEPARFFKPTAAPPNTGRVLVPIAAGATTTYSTTNGVAWQQATGGFGVGTQYSAYTIGQGVAFTFGAFSPIGPSVTQNGIAHIDSPNAMPASADMWNAVYLGNGKYAAVQRNSAVAAQGLC